jgi:hypothetical protein
VSEGLRSALTAAASLLVVFGFVFTEELQQCVSVRQENFIMLLQPFSLFAICARIFAGKQRKMI